MDERELYNKYHKSDNLVSTTISTIVVQGGPLQLVIALLRVRVLIKTYRETFVALDGIRFNAAWIPLYSVSSQVTRWNAN